MSDADSRHPLAGCRAVMLAEPTSLFPRALAASWQAVGLDTTIVTHEPAPAGGFPEIPGAHVLSAYRPWPLRRVLGTLAERAAAPVGPASSDGQPVARTNPWWRNLLLSVPAARVATRLRPRFVFGHEVYQYGMATALTRGTTRVLFPWGYDVREYARTSRAAFQMVTLALRRAHLVVPGSEEAARYLVATYGLDAGRVHGISWGVDLARFGPLDPVARAAVRARYGIPSTATLVLNVRRAHPDWGAEDGLAGFLQASGRHHELWYLGLGNSGPETRGLNQRLAAAAATAGAAGRVVLLEREIPLAEVAALMGASDVFLSLPRFVDMRSWSVLQGAAGGGAPILTDQAEFRNIERRGFTAHFVPVGDPAAVAQALDALASDPARRQTMQRANAGYLALHEDGPANMRRMLDLILAACQERERR